LVDAKRTTARDIRRANRSVLLTRLYQDGPLSRHDLVHSTEGNYFPIDEQGLETLGVKLIAGRTFRRRFELADHVKVNGASLANGLLTVDLKREIPEARKPRRIEIGTSPSDWSEPRQIEDTQRAA